MCAIQLKCTERDFLKTMYGFHFKKLFNVYDTFNFMEYIFENCLICEDHVEV